MGGKIIDTYGKVISYGIDKKFLRLDRLLLQGLMAGVWVGFAGHACSAAAGGFSEDIEPAVPKLLYAAMFPVAFVSIIMTGAELFTGNTMTMLICMFHRKVSILDLLINWILTLISNAAGAIFIAYFISSLSGTFNEGTMLAFVQHAAEKKIAHGFGSNFLRGVGANSFVCLAVWMVLAVDDVAGKVIVLWGPIMLFVLAGFEHIVANFYTISLGLLYNCNSTVGDAIVKNFIPVLLGNLVGGCGVVGSVYWYTCHETWTRTQLMGSNELAHQASVFLGRAGTSQHIIMEETDKKVALNAPTSEVPNQPGDSLRLYLSSRRNSKTHIVPADEDSQGTIV
eukprot:GHVS01104130.1.p1 GENE.GHVS01104130.1~~GHVS01104130.1.p1  ORF type:complete len:339 (-),score=22.95 GHVS01104130.1:595-1611(-)